MFKFNIMVLALLLSAITLSSKNVAKVYGKTITEDYIENVAMFATKGKYKSLPVSQKKVYKDKVFNELVRALYLSHLAKKDNIQNSKIYKKAYKEQLEQIKLKLLVNLYMSEHFKSMKVSKSEVKKFYTKNKKQFVVPALATVRHIVVKDEKTAKKLIKSIKNSSNVKRTFISDVKKYSIDNRTKGKGGLIGNIPKGKIFPALDSVIFNMKPGTVSKEPILTKLGFHIVYLDKITKKRSLTLSQARAKGLDNFVKRQKFANYLKKQMKKNVSAKNKNIKIYDKKYSLKTGN